MKKDGSDTSFICIISAVFLLASLCRAHAAPWGSTPTAPSDIMTNVQLIVELNTNRLVATEPLLLIATLRNNWTNEIRVSRVCELLDCDVVVRDASGQAMPCTRFGEKMKRAAGNAREHVRLIPPKESYAYRVPVNHLYDMTNPEKYYVIARTRVIVKISQDNKWFDVESQPLEVLVLGASGDK